MKKELKLLYILILFLFVDKVYAKVIVATDCEYTEKYEKWLQLSNYERSKTIAPTKCKDEGVFYVKPKH